MGISVWIWLGFIAFVMALLAFDLGVLERKDEKIGVRKSFALTGFYIVLALIFAAGIYFWAGTNPALEFLTGFVIEKSLSLDNIFVFVVIFRHFSVPPKYQHRVLFWGILGALVMRGAFIALGAALISRFDWIIMVFGAFLIFTGARMMRQGEVGPKDPGESRVLKFVRKHTNVTKEYHGHKFFIRQNGTRCATPLFLALVLIETTDVIFALDSIPAIFGVTRDPFIVFTSNVFAILGLRALYFALAEVVRRFRYLKYGLSLVLIFVGAKMMASEYYELPIWATLAVTLGLVIGSIVLSLVRGQKQERSRKA